MLRVVDLYKMVTSKQLDQVRNRRGKTWRFESVMIISMDWDEVLLAVFIFCEKAEIKEA